MAERKYEQSCPLACALDLLGERWTLLIVRDLVAGPKRYTDLRRGLPGLATDLLTERGRELKPAILTLARFGLGLLGESPSADAPPTPDQFALLLSALLEPGRAPAQPETWVFEGADGKVAVSIGREGVELHADPDELPRAPAARFIADVPTIYDLVIGRLDTPGALADRTLRIEGDKRALQRMRAALGGARG